METCRGHPHPGLAENVAGEPRQKYAGRRQLQVGLDRGAGRDISAGEKFSLGDRASLPAEGQLPGAAEAANAPFPRDQAQTDPVGREIALGQGHEQPGVRQRQVLDVEQPGERRQVGRALCLPGPRALENESSGFHVPQPRTVTEEATGNQFESQEVQAQEVALMRRTRDREPRKFKGRRGKR